MKFTKETARRTVRTFWQAFIAAVISSVSLIDTSTRDGIITTVIFSVVVPAIAAGAAAVMNLEKDETVG